MLKSFHKYTVLLVATAIFPWFQNCSEVAFVESSKLGKLGVCNGISCDLTPLTLKPGVITLLIALGDEANSQLVVNGASAQLIAETVVRYATPQSNPKILLVLDHNQGGEDPEDTVYVKDVLLARYNVTYIQEPVTGLTDADVIGYDLVWLNNPGHPMGSMNTRDVLIRFAGGVVLQGDDLTRGANFDMEPLTGMRHLENGTSVNCAGVNYAHDNNSGYKFRVSLDPLLIPGANASTISFEYGNDIDLGLVTRAGAEVIASSLGGPATCTESRPTIVRYYR